MDTEFVIFLSKGFKSPETPIAVSCPTRAPQGGPEATRHMGARMNGTRGVERFATCVVPRSAPSTIIFHERRHISAPVSFK